MKIIHRIIGLIFLIIGLISIFNFSMIGDRFLFLSQDGSVVPHSMLQLRICLSVLTVVGLILLFYSHLSRILLLIYIRLMSLSSKTFLKYILIAALAIRLIAVLLLDFHLWVDYEEYDHRGWLWAQTGEYTTDGYPTAYRAPAWPFLLSRLYLLFGHSPQLGVAGNLVFSLLIILLSFLIIRKIFGENIARWSALIMTFFPSQILFVNLLATEPMFTALFLGAIYFFVLFSEQNSYKWYFLLIGGILLGLSTLTRPLTLVYLIFPIIYWHLKNRDIKYLLKLTLPALFGFVLIVAPWMIRNQLQIGSFVISTNSGINLLIGNQPGSGMGWNQPVTDEFDFSDPTQEVTIDSIGWTRGWQYIKDSPLSFIKRGLLKVFYFYAVDMEGINYELVKAADNNRFDIYVLIAFIAELYYVLIILAAFLGIIIWFKNRNNDIAYCSGGYLFVLTILFWTMVHFVFFADGRFHFPIIPMIAAFAAVYINNMVDSKSLSIEA